MYCYKCGNKIPDKANFCDKCGAKQQNIPSVNQKTIAGGNTEFPKKKELTIEAVESSLKKPHSTEERILLLKAAGYAYEAGNHGAPKDMNRAAEYFRQAENLGDPESMCEHGRILMLNNDGDDMTFSAGVVKVCLSYKNGYAPAKDILQSLIGWGFFSDCKTIEDLFAAAEIPL